MLTGRKKIKTNRNLHNPFWHPGHWDATPARGLGAPGREAGATGQPPTPPGVPFLCRAQPKPEPYQSLLHPHSRSSAWQGSGRAQWEKGWEPVDLGSSPSSALTGSVSPSKFLSLSRPQGPHQ